MRRKVFRVYKIGKNGVRGVEKSLKNAFTFKTCTIN